MEDVDNTVTSQFRLLPEFSNTFYKDHIIKYIKGNIVIPNLFNSDIDKVCFILKIYCFYYFCLIKK